MEWTVGFPCVGLTCDASGVESVGSVTYTVSGGKSSVFAWQGHGITLTIPAGAVPPNTPPTKLQITASVAGQFKFPEGCELVSGVYCVSFPVEFAKPVALDIQHCLQLTSVHECSLLSFAVAKDTQTGPPYKFELVEGGKFTPHEQIGSLTVTHFSRWAILKIGKKSTARKGCAAQLFYRQNHGICNWTLHFVITPRLDICKTVCIACMPTNRMQAFN